MYFFSQMSVLYTVLYCIHLILQFNGLECCSQVKKWTLTVIFQLVLSAAAVAVSWDAVHKNQDHSITTLSSLGYDTMWHLSHTTLQCKQRHTHWHTLHRWHSTKLCLNWICGVCGVYCVLTKLLTCNNYTSDLHSLTTSYLSRYMVKEDQWACFLRPTVLVSVSDASEKGIIISIALCFMILIV